MPTIIKKRDSKEMLWKVNLHSDGYKNDLSYIIPYLAYSFMTAVGTSSGGWKLSTIYENDRLFNLWKIGGWSKFNITPLPICDKEYSKDIFIAYVERLSNETIVVLKKWGEIDKYSFSPEIYLECGHQSTQISHIDYYDFNHQIKKEIGTRYFVLHFPIQTDSNAIINIVEKGKKGMGWYCYGIHLK